MSTLQAQAIEMIDGMNGAKVAMVCEMIAFNILMIALTRKKH